jgi:hypothetical protein
MSELADLYAAELSDTAWRKSSYTANNGNCVEVASMPHSAGIAIRDSKNVDLAPARVSPTAWSTFLTAVVEGTIADQ